MPAPESSILLVLKVVEQMDKQTLLSEVNAFDELTKEERMEIDAISEMIKVGKGEGILSPEHKVEHLYILKKGQIRL